MKIGILGAGSIARAMAETVRLLNEHGHPEMELYAVGSRDLSKAQAFAQANGVQKAFGSYEAMLSDPDLELVYIATPHSHHYRHIKLCADYGKHILCEKPFTVSARQAADAFQYARSKGVLATEAMWTRFQPMCRTIRETLASGVIGTPRMIIANLGYFITWNHRIVVPELAGGALLDVGIYTLNFAQMVFGHPDSVQGLCTKNENGVDLTDSITLGWQDGRVANLSVAVNARTDRHGIICGDNGYLMVDNVSNPQILEVHQSDKAETRLIHSVQCPPQLTGYEYEVLETVDSIQKGLLECPSMPHAETMNLLEQMDHLRAQMGIHYPCEEID